MPRKTITMQGERFVLVKPAELRQLERLAAKAKDVQATSGKAEGPNAKASPGSNAGEALPPLPPADAEGNRPAVAFARVSIARSIVTERRALGITQGELARLAGMRQETLSRLEAGKHSPTVRTVERIGKAMEQARKRLAKKQARG